MKHSLLRCAFAVVLFFDGDKYASANVLGDFDGPKLDLGMFRGKELIVPDVLGLCQGILGFLCINDQVDSAKSNPMSSLTPSLPPTRKPTARPTANDPSPTWGFDPAEKWLGESDCRDQIDVLDRLELLALASFYFSTNNFLTNGPLYQIGWMKSCFPCEWSGITCNSSGNIVEISLASLGLEGRIHKYIGLLTELERIDLRNNHLEGKIPVELGYLSSLESVRLDNNLLRGTVPSALCAVKPQELIVDCWGFNPQVYCNEDCCTFCFGGPTLTPTSHPTAPTIAPSAFPSESPSGQTPQLGGNNLDLSYNLPTTAAEFTRKTPAPAIPTPGPTYDKDPSEIWYAESGCAAHHSVLEKLHVTVLANLYFSTRNTLTSGPLYDEGWLNSCNPCNWGRINCEENTLRELNLSSLGLRGQVHPYIGLLTDLHKVDLSENELTGEIPATLHFLTNADTILLHHNWLNGEVPSALCGLSLTALSADCQGSDPRNFCPTDCCTFCEV